MGEQCCKGDADMRFDRTEGGTKSTEHTETVQREFRFGNAEYLIPVMDVDHTFGIINMCIPLHKPKGYFAIQYFSAEIIVKDPYCLRIGQLMFQLLYLIKGWSIPYGTECTATRPL